MVPSSAMAELNLEPEDKRVAVITNPGYAEVKGSWMAAIR